MLTWLYFVIVETMIDCLLDVLGTAMLEIGLGVAIINNDNAGGVKVL